MTHSDSLILGSMAVGVVLGLLTAFPATAQGFQKGTAAYARGDYATALREMGPLAEAGDARAQNNLGRMFHRGHGVPRDSALAAAWFRKAAEQAHLGAQLNLAVMYLKGDGVPQDYDEALFWFREAAEKGHPSAQFNLAVMYRKGDGVPQDYDEALFWFREAAEKGHPRAQYNLAVMYLKGDGVPRNAVRAMAWFREAAARGHTGARKVLALFHSERPEAAPRGPVDADGQAHSAPEKTEAPAEPATEASQVAAWGAFRIQLGAVRSQAVAAQEAERLNRVHGPVLGDVRIVPVRADLGERGVFWRLRAGSYDDRAAATALCGRLAERNQACIVVKN